MAEMQIADKPLTDNEDLKELVNIIERLVSPKRRPRHFQNRVNILHYWNDSEFLVQYRLPKQDVQWLADIISNDVKNTSEWCPTNIS